MDIEKRNALVAHIGDVNNRNNNLPLVTLETFLKAMMTAHQSGATWKPHLNHTRFSVSSMPSGKGTMLRMFGY